MNSKYRLASNSQRFACFYLLNSEVKGMYPKCDQNSCFIKDPRDLTLSSGLLDFCTYVVQAGKTLMQVTVKGGISERAPLSWEGVTWGPCQQTQSCRLLCPSSTSLGTGRITITPCLVLRCSTPKLKIGLGAGNKNLNAHKMLKGRAQNETSQEE